MLSIEWILLYAALGAFVGFMSGLLGVGGGGLLVPILVSMLIRQDIHTDHVVHVALATSLACMLFTSISSIRAHSSQSSVMWDVVKGMAPGIMVGAFMATQIASHFKSDYIAIFFTLFIIAVALQTLLKWQPKPSKKQKTFVGLTLAGISIGFVSALASVGGGVLTVLYLRFKNVDIKNAIGTSAAIGLPIAITGTIGYMINGWSMTAAPYTFGFIHIPAFLAITMASVISAPYGAHFAQHWPEATLKKIFTLVCLALSVKMLISFW